MAFARWDPLRDLLAIQQRLDRFAPGPAGWQPPVDLYETPDAYVLTAEIPGIEREDIDIQTGDGRLTLSGVRPERAIACEQFHRLESVGGDVDFMAVEPQQYGQRFGGVAIVVGHEDTPLFAGGKIRLCWNAVLGLHDEDAD